MGLIGIPLVMYDEVVGEADIDDDGTVTATTHSPLQYGADLIPQLQSGKSNALSIIAISYNQPEPDPNSQP